MSALFSAKIAAAHLYAPREQLAAIVRALREAEHAELAALRVKETHWLQRQRQQRLLLRFRKTGEEVCKGRSMPLRPRQTTRVQRHRRFN